MKRYLLSIVLCFILFIGCIKKVDINYSSVEARPENIKSTIVTEKPKDQSVDPLQFQKDIFHLSDVNKRDIKTIIPVYDGNGKKIELSSKLTYEELEIIAKLLDSRKDIKYETICQDLEIIQNKVKKLEALNKVVTKQTFKNCDSIIKVSSYTITITNEITNNIEQLKKEVNILKIISLSLLILLIIVSIKVFSSLKLDLGGK